jgi:hypothetical protein
METLSDSFKRQAPSREKLHKWLAKESSSSMRETVNRPHGCTVTSSLDLNYFSVEDIADNWSQIDTDRSILIHAAMNMEIEGYGASGNWVGCKHYCGFGMKRITEFTGHLFSLIMAGGDWSNRGSILHDNIYYSSSLRANRFVKNRLLSPAYANCNGKEWYRDHKNTLSSLTRKYTCHTFVVHERDVSIFNTGYKEEVKRGWETTSSRLTHLLRLKNIKALSWHREISYTSIEHGVLHPHTHVMIWTDGEYSGEKISESLKLCKEISYSSHKWTKGSIPKLEGYYRYLNGVYSIEKSYKREWTPELSRKINTNLREMIWGSLEIFNGVRKVGTGNIPTNIPRLQKRGSRDKIKETKSAQKENHEQRISRRSDECSRGAQHIKRSKERNTRGVDGESLWPDGVEKAFKRATTFSRSHRGEPQLQNGLQECNARERG